MAFVCSLGNISFKKKTPKILENIQKEVVQFIFRVLGVG
jgi:hypothetical protein